MKFVKKYFVYLIIVLLVIVAVTLTIINKNRSKLPQPLEIISNPSGIEIYVNNQKYDSPTTINLVPGTYNFYFTKDGYLPSEKSVKIKPNKSNKLNIDLQPDTEYQPPEGAPVN